MESVDIMWSPGHRGIACNEYADMAATAYMEKGGEAEDATAVVAREVTSRCTVLEGCTRRSRRTATKRATRTGRTARKEKEGRRGESGTEGRRRR